MKTPTPTESEIADVYNSIRCAWGQCDKIYGTNAGTIGRVLNYWVKCEKELTSAREEITLLKTNLKIQTNHTENAVQDRADEHIELHNQIHKLTEQRDRLKENLERALNATVLNHRKDRWHIDAEYTLQLIQSITTNDKNPAAGSK